MAWSPGSVVAALLNWLVSAEQVGLHDLAHLRGQCLLWTTRGGEGVNDPANRKSGLALSAASSRLGRECIRSARHHINSVVISISYSLTSTFLIRVKATEQRPGCDPEPRVSIKLGFKEA